MRKIKLETIMITITFILTVISFVADRYDTYITSVNEAKTQRMIDESFVNTKGFFIKKKEESQMRIKKDNYPTRWF